MADVKRDVRDAGGRMKGRESWMRMVVLCERGEVACGGCASDAASDGTR